jgi:23S rRNA (pseudouridine1915-N3)-methyltransferase
MKIILLSISSKKEAWLEEAKVNYHKKLGKLNPFQIEELKPVKMEREDSEKKRKLECQNIMNFLKPDDWVVLFDEKGQNFSSLGFSKFVEQCMGSSKKRVVFIIGGAYGVEESVKQRANKTMTLSPFTLNHRVAFLVALEQIYRAFAIIKGLPYHND